MPSGFAPNAAGNGPPANSDVLALRWLDSNRNPIAEITGFSIKYSDFLAGASNSNLEQRYAFWVSLMNGNDRLSAAHANDLLEVGTGGTAAISSGEGNDHVYVWHQKNIVYDGGTGTDAVAFGAQFGSTPTPPPASRSTSRPVPAPILMAARSSSPMSRT